MTYQMKGGMGGMKEGMSEESECGSMHSWMMNLTDEQKKKAMKMKSEMKILFLEKKIKEMEIAIDMKKKMIELIRQMQKDFA
jgi:hypothetical protein